MIVTYLWKFFFMMKKQKENINSIIFTLNYYFGKTLLKKCILSFYGK